MLRKSQEGHVKAEKDILAAAASSQAFVRLPGTRRTLVDSQAVLRLSKTKTHLYLVLDYMGGGTC